MDQLFSNFQNVQMSHTFVRNHGFVFRTVSWTHPELGEPFKIEVETKDSPTSPAITSPIELSAAASSLHKYIFSASDSREITLDESNVLPTIFALSGGEGAQIRSVRVSRYGKTISGVDFADPKANLYDCINVCSKFADSSSLWLGENHVSEVILDFINEIECRKLQLLYYTSIRDTGREACTSPPINVQSVAGLKAELADLLGSSKPYRTLMVNVTSGFNEPQAEALQISTNRGLVMEVDRNIVDASEISGVEFSVEFLGELYLTGLDLKEPTRILIAAEGLAEISGGTLCSLSDEPPMIENAGLATMTSLNIANATRLVNVAEGSFSFTYVEFLDSSSIVNVPGGKSGLSVAPT